MPQATHSNIQRNWKFERLEDGWMWEHMTSRGGIISAGLFVNLAQCIRDARSFGFLEARWERRKVHRIDTRPVQKPPFEYDEGDRR